MRVEKGPLIDALDAENGLLERSLSACAEQIAELGSALDGPELQGEAYEAIRERITSLRTPLAKALHNMFEALRDGNDRNSAAVSALPETSPGVADADEAWRRIDELEGLNRDYRLLVDDAAASGLDAEAVMAGCEPMIEANRRIIDELRGAILRIQAYADASSGYYADADAALRTLAAADRSIASYLSGGGYGDLGWTDAASAVYGDRMVAERLGISKDGFSEMMSEQFGFDEEIAAIMWNVYARLYERYPGADQDFIDWAWLRLMGGICYDGVAWDMTAGRLAEDVPFPLPRRGFITVSGESYLVLFLGLSVADYEILAAAVIDQNDKAPEGPYADFAHQCAAAAAEYDVRRGNTSTLDRFFSEGASERAQYAGWMGDCVVARENDWTTSLGPDDYKSDLDGHNIAVAAFDQGIPYHEAARQYYADLDNMAYTRADKFLENNGGYDNVVNMLYANLTTDSDLPATLKGRSPLYGPDVYTVTFAEGDQTGTRRYISHTVPEKVEIIRRHEHLADTSRFLDALENGKNELD